MKMDTLIVKREYKLLKELLVVLHVCMMRFYVAFIFEKLSTLLLRTNGLSIVYKENFSGGTLIRY